MTTSNIHKEIVLKLYESVWSLGELNLVNTLVADSYTIHSDPGDAWEGQSLTQETYRQRVLYSRNAFPDLKFTVQKIITENNLVAVVWSAIGTHLGDLSGLPATKKRLTFNGQTLYQLLDGKVCGHWQSIDRVGFMQQLRGPPPAPGSKAI